MGAALESLPGKGVRVPTTIRWQQQTPLKTLLLCSLYDFKNLKSSSTWFNPCFPLRRAFLLLYVVLVYLLPSILEANTCVNCALILTYLHICIHHITLCWQYPWDMHVESWKQPLKLISSFVLLLCLYYELIALWVNSCARLLMLVLKVLFMKSFAICYLFVSNYRLLPWVTSFISYAL